MSESNTEVFNQMIGKTFKRVEKIGDDRLEFDDMVFYHSPDCCESVQIEEIIGDLNDLVGSPIIQAECVISSDQEPKPEYADSWTWSFYKFATNKGSVTVRWLGESNGYYGETVVFFDGETNHY